MRFKKIIKLFKNGNVCVCGLRGKGKDMLMANVVVRRKKEYVSNIDYGEGFHPFHYEDIACGFNTYNDFIKGTLKPYSYPFKDGTDVYISDCGVYFPSQYCSELNRDYKYMATFQALSRHVGKCNIHVNAQALNRVWDKIREQSDTYILCRSCIYLFGFVIQRVTIYDRYESAVNRMKPLKLPLPSLATKEMRLMRKMEYARYEAQHGIIQQRWLFYKNKSTYDTRRFKTLLKGETTA